MKRVYVTGPIYTLVWMSARPLSAQRCSCATLCVFLLSKWSHSHPHTVCALQNKPNKVIISLNTGRLVLLFCFAKFPQNRLESSKCQLWFWFSSIENKVSLRSNFNFCNSTRLSRYVVATYPCKAPPVSHTVQAALFCALAHISCCWHLSFFAVFFFFLSGWGRPSLPLLTLLLLLLVVVLLTPNKLKTHRVPRKELPDTEVCLARQMETLSWARYRPAKKKKKKKTQAVDVWQIFAQTRERLFWH